jgi:hypothetical protein
MLAYKGDPWSILHIRTVVGPLNYASSYDLTRYKISGELSSVKLLTFGDVWSGTGLTKFGLLTALSAGVTDMLMTFRLNASCVSSRWSCLCVMFGGYHIEAMRFLLLLDVAHLQIYQQIDKSGHSLGVSGIPWFVSLILMPQFLVWSGSLIELNVKWQI